MPCGPGSNDRGYCIIHISPLETVLNLKQAICAKTLVAPPRLQRLVLGEHDMDDDRQLIEYGESIEKELVECVATQELGVRDSGHRI